MYCADDVSATCRLTCLKDLEVICIRISCLAFSSFLGGAIVTFLVLSITLFYVSRYHLNDALSVIPTLYRLTPFLKYHVKYKTLKITPFP